MILWPAESCLVYSCKHLHSSGGVVQRVDSRARWGRKHLRGDRGCISERCRAPQGEATALHDAAFAGRAAVVEQLLAAGAFEEAAEMVRVKGRCGQGWSQWQDASFRAIPFLIWLWVIFYFLIISEICMNQRLAKWKFQTSRNRDSSCRYFLSAKGLMFCLSLLHTCPTVVQRAAGSEGGKCLRRRER